MSNFAGALVFVALTIVVMITLLRRGALRERFVVWWVVLGVGVVVAAVFPALLPWVAGLVGIETPANLVFFLASLLLLLICVQFSVELSTLDEKTRRLSEEIAIMRAALESAESEPRDPGPAAS